MVSSDGGCGKLPGRSTSNNAIEVKQYAEKRRLAVERAILIRVERELKESKKFAGDPIGLHKKAKLVTLRILKRQEKKRLKEQEEWEKKRKEADRERQRRILMAKEMAKPYQPPSLYDDDDDINDMVKRKKEERASGNFFSENRPGKKTMESIDLLARDIPLGRKKSANNVPFPVSKEILANPTMEVAPKYTSKANTSRPPSVVSENASEDVYDDAFEEDDAPNRPILTIFRNRKVTMKLLLLTMMTSKTTVAMRMRMSSRAKTVNKRIRRLSTHYRLRGR